MALEGEEIGQCGKEHILAWLKSDGYSIVQDSQQAGSADVEADGPEKILVQVKTAVWPASPAGLSEEEARSFRSRAASLGRVAFLAHVTIDPSGNVIKGITWARV